MTDHACIAEGNRRQQAREAAALAGYDREAPNAEVLPLLCNGTGVRPGELLAYGRAAAEATIRRLSELDEDDDDTPGDFRDIIATALARATLAGYHAAQFEAGQ